MRVGALLLLCGVLSCTRGSAELAVQAAAQPLWSPTATQPQVARAAPALLLPSGQLLVAGGGSAITELFDPATESWSLGPPLGQPQSGNVLTLWDGRALSVSGVRAEVLDGTWQLLSPPAVARTGAVAVALPDGRVLLAQGQGPASNALERLELDGGWTLLNPSTAAHVGHSAVLLPSGNVSVIGGPVATAELYDPVFNTWTPRPAPPRFQHSALLLPSGELLLVGGRSLDDGGVLGAERYDTISGVRVPVSGLRVPRLGHASVALPSGDVLVTGGEGAAAAQSAERYVVAFDRFVPSGCLNTPRSRHSAAVLPDAGVLLVGGLGIDGGALARSERLDLSLGLLAQGQPCQRDCECGTGFCVDGVCCDSACNGGACQTCATGSCTLRPSTAVCRASAGLCDVEERCSGNDKACPTDVVRVADAGCRPAAGLCDVAEACDGVSAACPADRVVAPGISCRSSAGPCDVAELCDGVAAQCGSDRLRDAGVVCRAASSGGCDVAEVCSGIGPLCPPDGVAAPGTVCRPSTAICDAVERCNGLSNLCPTDAVVTVGVPCRPAVGPCDEAETCQGARECPVDRLRDAGAVCRASTAPCDAAEVCSGASSTCPVDGISEAGTVCRAASGACDAVERCNGTTTTCPPDLFRDAGAECRPVAGECDLAEQCSGTSAACPADGVRPTPFVCRPSVGVCDVAEACDGVAAACPADAFAGADVVCRASTGGCDVEERCAGAATCPEEQDAGECTDGGPSGPKHYAGWSCSQGPGAPAWALLMVLALAGVRRRARWLSLAVLTSSTFAAAEPAVTSDFSVRVSGAFMRNVLASRIGAEVGANVSLTPRFDAAVAVSLGAALGGRVGVTWHLKDDGEWVRPFVQARALLHPVPEGIAGGGGAWAGVLVPLGPGRIQAGGLFEAYLGPSGYAPWDAFVTLGYELDIYRRIERAGMLPEPEFGGREVPPLKTVDPGPAVEPAESAAPGGGERALPAPAPEERTRVVTRVSLSKDLVFFDERRIQWAPKSASTVQKVIEVLRRYPQLKRVEIQGHADDGDTDADCMQLSLKRAERVLTVLLEAGIDPNRLTAKAYGRQKNRVPIKAPARKREPNRRVEFLVLEEAW